MAPTPASGPPDPGGTPEPGPALSAAEREEYERLRRAATLRHRRSRRVGASLLLVLTLVLAPLAVVAAWVHSQVFDTGRYVQTVAPLASDPVVQNAVTDRLTTRVVDEIDVQAITASLTKALANAGAPPKVVDASTVLTGPLRSAVTDVVRRTVNKVITSDLFREVWVNANRRAHSAVVGMLSGNQNGALRAQGDTVKLDIGVVVDQVKQQLVNAGFQKASAIPTPDRQITLFQTEQLTKAQNAVRLLNIVGIWLPVLAVVLAAAAVWAAPAHRFMLLVTASGIGVMMVVLLVALAVARQIYLNSVPPTALPADAAAAVFDTFVRFLRDSARTLLVVAVITALAAYLYGPGRGARGVRTLTRKGTGATGRALERGGLHTGTAGHWLDTHRAWTTGIVIGAGALTLVLWNYPTTAVVALVLAVVLVVLFALAVLADAAGPDAAPASGGAGRAVP
ncbi:hypothetical protein [Streptomyces tropicalis]|uniref:Integral membrane protein n=1 Tax=Streptomyces tropicalis TaxID=3034234 RepID=A0ABT6A1W9_9ACTN|nr:hypothetical protein [Streptomyces tropicalis]MDF3298646.1 hypothetical protein [Streptomyces tropicalis]